LLQALHPEEPWRNKIRGEIPFGEEVSLSEEIIKEEEGRNEKGQTSYKIR
jgi:hypothetical protein